MPVFNGIFERPECWVRV